MSLNIILIRECFELTKPILDQIINRFYENMFLDFPQSKVLVSQYDINNQKLTLMNTLITVIDNLDKSSTLSHFLVNFGERLSKFGIEDYHYDWVGHSFIKTLSQFLGRSWSNELNQEWGKVYNLISQTMQKGAEFTMIPNDHQITESHQEVNSSNIKIELTYLSDEFKHGIQLAVKALILKQVKQEVEKYLKEEISEIARMTPEELISMAIQR